MPKTRGFIGPGGSRAPGAAERTDVGVENLQSSRYEDLAARIVLGKPEGKRSALLRGSMIDYANVSFNRDLPITITELDAMNFVRGWKTTLSGCVDTRSKGLFGSWQNHYCFDRRILDYELWKTTKIRLAVVNCK